MRGPFGLWSVDSSESDGWAGDAAPGRRAAALLAILLGGATGLPAQSEPPAHETMVVTAPRAGDAERKVEAVDVGSKFRAGSKASTGSTGVANALASRCF